MKPNSSEFEIMESSATSWQAQAATLMQQVVRRLSYTSKHLVEEKSEILEEFIGRLKGSGYREGKSTENDRIRKKMLGKTSWYKEKGGKGNLEIKEKVKGAENTEYWGKKKADEHNSKEDMEEKEETKEITAVMFVSRTPRGELASRLREKEKELGKIGTMRMKILERNGAKLVNTLTRSDPWGDESCGRGDCRTCQTEEKGKYKCRVRNITYKNTCIACAEQGKRTEYLGESSCSLYERTKEHDQE